MKIAIDLQGIQSEGSRARGIGRYSFEIIRNIIEYSPESQFILVANGALKDLRIQFNKQLSKENVSYFEWFAPCPLDYCSKNNIYFTLGKYLRSYAFACLHVDIVLVTSFVEGFSDNCLTDFDHDLLKVNVVSIFYDLIPLINPNLYLNSNPVYARFYKSKLNSLTKLDGLLAISESSLNEVVQYLDYPKENVFNISSACDKQIFNTNKSSHISESIELSQISPFLLYTGACDPRKNIKGLLQAYSQLSSELSQYKLVLVGKLLQPELELIDSWIKDFKIDRNLVIKTGYISDADLVLLYRNCSLFIFPSLHEGFGLPVLEAMCCGAPVIGSKTTSVQEVIGNQSAMFDPYNINEIRELIEKALLDQDFKEELLTNAITQSEKFSWKKTAESCFKAFAKVILNKKTNSTFRWPEIVKMNSDYYKFLISKIYSNKRIRSKIDVQLSSLIAASIDKINSQIDALSRSISNNDSIRSWRVEGPFDSSYSLSILNRCFAEALNNNLEKLTIHITEGPGDYTPNIEYLKNYSELYSIYNHSINRSSDSEVVSRNLYPPRVKDLKAKYNLLHSYGWEESEFPSEWVDDFNTSLQGLTVMSLQVKKTLIDNGVNIPIHVSGLGLDHLDASKSDIDLQIQAKTYKILHVSSCFPRKGVDVLLEAYSNAFTSNDDVSLIIKTFYNPHNNLKTLIEEYQTSNPLFPDVIVLDQEFNDQELKALFLLSDVLVAPSRGEGFGLPIGEAMRLGIPVITTGWGGQLDFCNAQNSWLIDYTFVAAKSHFRLDNSYWAEPSSIHLSGLLLEVYNSSDKEIYEKTNLAKKVAKTFNWDKVAKENINFVQDKLRPYNNRFFQLGCMTTWDSRCGIASYSKNLFANISEEITIFSPYNEVDYSGSSQSILPSWDLDQANQDFNYLLDKIISENITSLLIQFNYGFFDFYKLSDLMDKLKENNINIIILLHSTIDPENDSEKSLRILKSSLDKCDRVLVHTLADLNRLKDIDLIDNVSLFPHGILDFEPKKNYIRSLKNRLSMNTIKTIATYGFCLPNKGYKELIQAVGLLRDRNFHVKLNIFSAIYNDDYYWCYEDLLDLIDQLDLGGYVNVISTYMTNEETLSKLNEHDMLVFPYQSSNESSSASVRQGLASNRRVLVTPLDIFEDVSDLIDYLPGFKPDQISQGIYEAFTKDQKFFDLTAKSEKSSLLALRRFSRLSSRLIGIIKSLEINNL